MGILQCLMFFFFLCFKHLTAVFVCRSNISEIWFEIYLLLVNIVYWKFSNVASIRLGDLRGLDPGYSHVNNLALLEDVFDNIFSDVVIIIIRIFVYVLEDIL